MARKGEMAPGVAARHGRAAASTMARIEVFRKLDVAALKVEPQLMDRFANFGRLAEWSEPSIGIYPISPKTLRKHLDHVYEGGYRSFQASVAALKEQLESDATPQVSKKILALIASAANEKSERATGAAIDMTARYLDLLDRVRKLSMSNSAAERQFRKHLQIFGESHPHIRRVK